MQFSSGVDEFVEEQFGTEVDLYSRDERERLFMYYDRHRLSGNPNMQTISCLRITEFSCMGRGEIVKDFQ